MPPPQDVAKRTITSVTWQTISNIGRIPLGFIRTTLLARWLPVEVFGIYSFAHAWVILSGEVANFGMGGAFMHRAPETEDEEDAAAIHFTLKLLLTTGWAMIMLLGTLLFAEKDTQNALLILTITQAGIHLTQTPQLILYRRVVHRRLALLELISSLLITLISVFLAWQGAELWALLAMDIVLLVLRVIMLYGWRPVWRPHLTWSPTTVRYYFNFGRHNFLAHLLAKALDRIDDLWTGIWLGDSSLGFYSRSYEFSTYPRKILSRSINAVATGTYAELKHDRLRLSRAFFRINAFLIRSGFFLGGLMALTAPEFIRLILGEKWLPMLTSFRLMLIFTLLDPIKVTLANLFTAIGEPEQVARARGLQLLVLVLGLFILGPWLEASGVALSVDIMLVVGIAILIRQARAHVDFSLRRLFLAPGSALLLGILFPLGINALWSVEMNDWLSGSFKIIIFSVIYGLLLVIFEYHQLRETLLALGQRFNISPTWLKRYSNTDKR